jgi:nitroreductase
MKETLKTIADRYSCRDFASTPLTTDQLQAIVEAALASPSAMNRQPWHVIAVTDKALIDEMDADGMATLAMEDKSGYERFLSRGGKLFYNAPCMIIAAADGSSYAPLDCGILSQNVALAAHALGLGSVICGMARLPLNGARGESFLKRLHFPEGFVFGMAILVGPPQSGKAPHALDFTKVTYIG